MSTEVNHENSPQTAAPLPEEPSRAEASEPVDALSQAHSRIAELENLVATEKDRYLRQIAEIENSRRRMEKDHEAAKKYALLPMATELVNVADNLRRALNAMPADGVQEPLARQLLEGVAATERELLRIFEKWNIKKFDPLGQPFDPNFHQSMMERADTRTAAQYGGGGAVSGLYDL